MLGRTWGRTQYTLFSLWHQPIHAGSVCALPYSSNATRKPADPLSFIYSFRKQAQTQPSAARHLLFNYLSPHSYKNDILLLHKADPLIIPHLVDMVRSHSKSDPLCEKILSFLDPLDTRIDDSNSHPLVLQSLTWQRSSAQLIENLQKGERVRPLQKMEDVKHRLSAGRRCFALFDPQDSTMSDPLIFVWVALRQNITARVSEILSELRPLDHDETNANTAVFYGISSSGRGSKGSGNLLIKEACRVLCAELPQLKHFVTLSPLPAFMKWIESSDADTQITPWRQRYQSSSSLLNKSSLNDEEFSLHWKQLLKDQKWVQPSTQNGDHELMQEMLLALARHYLTHIGSQGRVFDPVGNFHLKNGACIYQVNFLGDTSPRGMDEAAGLTVNYYYELDKTHERSANYINKKEVHFMNRIETL